VATSLEKGYPNLTRWVTSQGWIELGQEEYSSSLVRALDAGGMVWEGSTYYGTLDEAFDALETALAECSDQNY
jgi:hypothetical protein